MFSAALSVRHTAARSAASMASTVGLEEVARIIKSCIDLAVAPATLKIYRRVKRDFLDFVVKLGLPLSGMDSLRNVFIAHLISLELGRLLCIASRLPRMMCRSLEG